MSLLDVAMYAALLLICGAAFLKGGRPERLVATAELVAFGVNASPGWRALVTGQPIELMSAPATLAVDILLLGALVGVAVSCRPHWTLFAAAFQLIATLISFVRLTNTTLSPVAYFTAQNTLWWLTLASLAFGVWAAGTRRETPADPAIAGSAGARSRPELSGG
jgi:hypothetical protein